MYVVGFELERPQLLRLRSERDALECRNKIDSKASRGVAAIRHAHAPSEP